MSPMIVALVLIGIFVLIAIIWAVWQLIKCVAILILIAVIFVALWYFGALSGLIPF
ncbi:MAG: hypothetical protein R6U17_05910 [Thermoplasmata archaeon]